MILQRLWIKKYKHLQNFTIDFRERDELTSPSSVRFLIGKNGTGKSAFLEALGLIFSRLMHQEIPGFDFEIEYQISNKQGSFNMQLKCHSKELKIIQRASNTIFENDGLILNKSDLKDFLPSYLIAVASGPHNELDDVLVHSPIDALKSDLYDLQIKSKTIRAELDGDSEFETINEYELKLNLIRQLYTEPRFLFFDTRTLQLVLIVLMSVLPLPRGEVGVANDLYVERRAKLFKNLHLSPVGFTLIVDENRHQEHLQNGKIESIFTTLVLGSNELNQRVASEQKNNGCYVQKDKRFVYFKFDDIKGACRVDALNEYNPMQLLAELMAAYRNGILADFHLSYKRDIGVEEDQDMLLGTALSDGEFLWVTRIALLLVANAADQDNMLFIFDEPDVHLNESWIVDYISYLHEMTDPLYQRGDNLDRKEHEVLIATHSSLILTDADSRQLYLFVDPSKEKNGERFAGENQNIFIEENTQIQSLGANRDEVSKKIFGTSTSAGNFTRNQLKKLLEKQQEAQQKRKDIQHLVRQLGPGYLRFRLRGYLDVDE